MKSLFCLILVLFLALVGCSTPPESSEGETPPESNEGETTPEEPVADETPGRGTARVTLGAKNVEIEYGRPSLNGRDMLGQLPVGQPWRMGMNEATKLTTDTALQFGETQVPAGTYRLWAIRPDENTWELVINSDMGRRNPDNDVARIPLEIGENESPVETFTIELSADGDQATLTASWDTLRLSASFL